MLDFISLALYISRITISAACIHHCESRLAMAVGVTERVWELSELVS